MWRTTEMQLLIVDLLLWLSVTISWHWESLSSSSWWGDRTKIPPGAVHYTCMPLQCLYRRCSVPRQPTLSAGPVPRTWQSWHNDSLVFISTFLNSSRQYIYTSTILNKYWCSNHFMWIGNKRSWDLLDRIIAFVLAKVYLNNTQWKLKKSIPLNPHFESLSSSRSALGTDSVAPWNTVFMWALGGAELGLGECM